MRKLTKYERQQKAWRKKHVIHFSEASSRRIENIFKRALKMRK